VSARAGVTVSETGFIVRVAEAEPRVRSLRDRFHPVARLGVPAHVTVLFPFMAPERIDEQTLRTIRAALAGTVGFAFSLSRIGRFPLTAYLAPEPVAPFVALTEGLARAFPEFPPFGGEFETIVPHLTVAHGSAPDAEVAHAELARVIATGGPIHARCDAVELLENSSGVWRRMHVFPLLRAGAAGRDGRTAPRFDDLEERGALSRVPRQK